MPWPSRQQYQQRNVYNTLNNNQYGRGIQQNAQARTPYTPNNGNPHGAFNMPTNPQPMNANYSKPQQPMQRPPMPNMVMANRRFPRFIRR